MNDTEKEWREWRERFLRSYRGRFLWCRRHRKLHWSDLDTRETRRGMRIVCIYCRGDVLVDPDVVTVLSGLEGTP